MKKVLIAVEQDQAEEILTNILKIKPYSNNGEWKFAICSDAKRLLREAIPDVLVLSRNLPGIDPFKLLEKVKKKFGKTAHIVLLVWSDNERSRNYVKKANSLGLRNHVEGKLPGKRPYILPVALQKNKREVIRTEQIQFDETRQEGRRKITALAYGGTWPSEKIHISKCKSVAEVKRKANRADLILISSQTKDAQQCIMSLRKAGIIVPIVGIGAYMLELISVGATGCVEKVDNAVNFL